MAEPNLSARGNGVPVPSNVTRILFEPVAAEMLSNANSQTIRTIKWNRLLRTHRINGAVMLSEAKHLWLSLRGLHAANKSEILRFAQNDIRQWLE